MGKSDSEQVFTNRGYKIRTFIFKSLRAFGLLAFMIVAISFRAVLSGKLTLEQGIRRPLMLLGVAALISMIIGAYNLFKLRKACVRITDDKVDVTVGSSHDVFPVEDYIGPRFSGTRSNIKRKLVFKDEEDPESNITYNLPADNRLFMEVSDAILIRKHEKLDDVKYKAFKGDKYKGELAEGIEIDAKKIFWLLLAMVIFTPAAGYFVVFKILKNPVEHIGSISVGVLLWILGVIALCLIARAVYLENKETLKTLTFDSKALTINGKEFPYNEIETVSMTPPYLHSFSASRRELSIKLYDAKKPVIFYVGHRPDDENSKEISENRSCIYPALYERVRTDRFIESKFKVQ